MKGDLDPYGSFCNTFFYIPLHRKISRTPLYLLKINRIAFSLLYYIVFCSFFLRVNRHYRKMTSLMYHLDKIIYTRKWIHAKHNVYRLNQVPGKNIAHRKIKKLKEMKVFSSLTRLKIKKVYFQS